MAKETTKRHKRRPSLGELKLAVRRHGDVILAKLLENNHKPYWRDEVQADLLEKLRDEVEELAQALADGDRTEIMLEAADVGALSMMICDNALHQKVRKDDG